MKPRCISESVNALHSLDRRRKELFYPRPLLNFPVDNQLRVLEAGKRGSFVLLSEAMHQERAIGAVVKHFQPARATLKTAKRQAMELREKMSLTNIVKSIKKAEGLQYKHFLSQKHIRIRAHLELLSLNVVRGSARLRPFFKSIYPAYALRIFLGCVILKQWSNL